MDYIKLYMVTYNVATQGSTENLKELLGLNNNVRNLPDFYAIGLQEVKSQPLNMVLDVLFDDPWTTNFRETLAPYGYVKVKTVRLVGIVLSVFCLRKHLIHLRDMEDVCTRTGLMGFWGNKGAVSLRLQIYGCSLCLVNCHMTPHDHLLKERIEEYNTVVQSQHFNSPETSAIFFHDYVFWMGDLNFRIGDAESLTSGRIESEVKGNQLVFLLEHDQLLTAMSSGEAFSELTEADITFPPTYKYNMGSSSYDMKRRPAWTDRILFKVNHNVYENITLEINQSSYKCFNGYSVSDHKPVVAEFTVKVFSDYAERIVKFSSIQNWFVNEVNTATCLIGNDVTPSSSDWVAIFHENFTSLSDYIGYVYVPLIVEEGVEAVEQKDLKVKKDLEKIELKFHENFLRCPGRYHLVYMSQDSGSVLGMSSAFTVSHRQDDPDTSPNKDW